MRCAMRSPLNIARWQLTCIHSLEHFFKKAIAVMSVLLGVVFNVIYLISEHTLFHLVMQSPPFSH